MTSDKEKLRKLILKAVPFECIQRKAVLEGIRKMSDKTAKEALAELESAYVLSKKGDELEDASNGYEKSISKNKKRK